MLDLRERGKDVRAYVSTLEELVIQALATFNVNGERSPGKVGIWVNKGNGSISKIASIGLRIRRWIAYHGISINVEPNLAYYQGIIPCGNHEKKYGVTSLIDLGFPVSMEDLDIALISVMQNKFGPFSEHYL